MSTLKEDTALAVNLLAQDQKVRQLMEIKTKADLSTQIVPMRQQPGEAMNKPLVCVYPKVVSNQGGPVTLNQLVVDVYTPLPTQRTTGVAFDITRRIKEILDKKPVGRGLRWQSTDPDRRSSTGWHKATVLFTFLSAQY